MIKMPVSVDNFKKIIDKEYYYIDKTNFILDVLNEEIMVYTRPHRFGKSLNLSMLYYFFSINEKENAYLFDHLAICKSEEAMKHQNQYPVIFITLKEMRNITFENQFLMYLSLIQGIIRKHEELFHSNQLNDFDKETLYRYINGKVNQVELQNALKFLTECLKKHYKKNVIILIDEYDVPLQDAYLNGYYEEMVHFLRNAFSSALKTNDNLEKGILTGCLRIARESIFTGLNNFNVYSITENISSTYFGFTQNEIKKLLFDIDQENTFPIIKEWYDGYQFGENEIYNPWSVLKYIQQIMKEQALPESYWANTSSNDIIYRYIRQSNPQMKLEFDLLTSGKSIIKTIKPELTYREMDHIDNIYSFLLFTGYLKIKSRIDRNTYELMIPNKEIEFIYIDIFHEWFQQYTTKHRASFIESLMKEDRKKAEEILSNILFQSISYFDYNEAFYHGFMVGMFTDYPIASNQEAGLGRYDIAMLPPYRKNKGLLLEFKVSNCDEAMEKDAEIACQQILDRKYLIGLEQKGYTNLLAYGIAFHKKSCHIALVKR